MDWVRENGVGKWGGGSGEEMLAGYGVWVVCIA
jgi:hypothetical protein